MKTLITTFIVALVMSVMSMNAGEDSQSNAQPKFFWVVVTEQPDHTALAVAYDRDNGENVRVSKHEALWFDMTMRRQCTQREFETGKFNEDFRRNAFRYWTTSAIPGIDRPNNFSLGMIDDWYDGKQLVALVERCQRSDAGCYRQDREPPSKWIDPPADIVDKLRAIGRMK
jgi:hypothetical protein